MSITKKYAVIDTETSGLFDFSKPADAPGQPRLANLGVVLLTPEAPESEWVLQDQLVKPDGWTMTPEATKVNGLTDATLQELGEPVHHVLTVYSALIRAGWIICSYNAQFDTKMMRGELRRAGLPDLFETTPNICLMRAATDVVKCPTKNGRGYKFPKLAEACKHFGIHQPAAHSALGDAKSAAAILVHLHRLGKLPEADVHYAKNPPAKTS